MHRVLGVLLILLLVVMPASAQMADPGMITPQHGFLYQLEMLFDNFVILISPNKDLARLRVMDERLAEYEMTHDQRALNDYTSKLNELSTADETIKHIIEAHITKHIEVLKQVKEMVPEEAKPAIDRAIEESSRCKEVLESVPVGQHESHLQSESYIEIPDAVRTGERCCVAGTICNSFDTEIKSVKVDITARKKGLEGFVMNKHESRTANINLQPGECYSDKFCFAVPETVFGLPAGGYWEIHVVVTAYPQNEKVINIVKDIVVS